MVLADVASQQASIAATKGAKQDKEIKKMALEIRAKVIQGMRPGTSRSL